MIPYGKQDISQSDVDSVIQVLKSDWLTQGPMVPRFEEAIKEFTGASYAHAVSNATSALHIACLALGVGKGDIVWTSSITFVASANCALYCGASVDFIDIDSNTYNISVKALEIKLKEAKSLNKIPKAIIPVHFAGQSAEMESIYSLSKKYGFHIIEDASHAIGGHYKNRPIGACQFSDICVFSFHPVKIITTGEGGMALTNDKNLSERLNLLRSHGVNKFIEQKDQKPKDEIWNYQLDELGFNYRMTDIQAALGLSQIKRLKSFIRRRHEIATRYNEAFRDLPIVTPWQHKDAFSSYHLYPVCIKEAICGISQKEFYNKLTKLGIGVNLHYIPVYRHPYYERLGFELGYCPEAERYFKETLTLPIHPSLLEKDQEMIIDIISDTLLTKL